MPLQLALARTVPDAHRHAHVVLDQVSHHLADRAESLEQIEHQTDRRLCLLIGIEHHLAGWAPQITHGHRLAELAPPSFGSATFQHARLEDVQLRFRHRPLQPEQQTVVVVGRIIHAVGIRNQRVEQGADLQQLVPVPA